MLENVGNDTVSQLLSVEPSQFVLFVGIGCGVLLFWIVSNWNKIKLPYEWLMAWYQNKRERDNMVQMIKNDHERTTELINKVEILQDEVDHFNERQATFHNQTLDIRGDINNKVNDIIESNKKRDIQIDALMMADMVLLGEEINKKYKQYISFHGIPEDEVDEFTNLHTVYKSLGGNHTGDAKFDYVMKHLDVIPVETKLVYDNN